jgi:hypothetical protein
VLNDEYQIGERSEVRGRRTEGEKIRRAEGQRVEDGKKVSGVRFQGRKAEVRGRRVRR